MSPAAPGTTSGPDLPEGPIACIVERCPRLTEAAILAETAG